MRPFRLLYKPVNRKKQFILISYLISYSFEPLLLLPDSPLIFSTTHIISIALHSHLSIALEAGKVTHVPRSTFRLGALVGEDNLIAGAASGFQSLGVVPAAIESAVPPEVDQIYQQLTAHAADEAGGMPESGGSGAAGRHGHLAGRDRASALAASGAVRPLELARVSATEGLALPLGREHAQFALLLLAQAAAISRLVVVRR